MTMLYKCVKCDRKTCTLFSLGSCVNCINSKGFDMGHVACEHPECEICRPQEEYDKAVKLYEVSECIRVNSDRRGYVCALYFEAKPAIEAAKAAQEDADLSNFRSYNVYEREANTMTGRVFLIYEGRTGDYTRYEQ